ncbi:MAG: hypothetical protein PHU51_01855 [Candidatus Nanoarchaeia archaeon]|nr:hypothetical protein [Candidatus Nanoarchaeia archaeon]
MITYDHFTPPSILSPDDLKKVLNLEISWRTEYAPLRHKKFLGRHYFDGINKIYLGHPELDVVKNLFETSNMSLDYKISPYLLALMPKKETILQTQEIIKEIGDNSELHNYWRSMLREQRMFNYADHETQGNIFQITNISPEKVEKFLQSVLNMEKFSPKSKGISYLLEWASKVKKDDLYSEIQYEKELAKQNRIIMIAEPEFGDGLVYGKLKKNIVLEDVIDLYHSDVEEFKNYEVPHEHKEYGRQQFIKYSNGLAKLIGEEIVLSSAQKLNIVNEKTAELLTTSLFAAVSQINHVVAGANFYKYCLDKKYPLSFPKIVDEGSTINMKNILPIRMVLEECLTSSLDKINNWKRETEKPSSIDFSIDSKINQIEGPNNRGKTEILRTIFLATHFANRGFPVCAENYETPLFHGAHFLKMKKTPRRSGSEMKSDIFLLRQELKGTYPGDLILIDEVGDATNNETSMEFVNRLYPVLLDRGNVTVLTTHQSGISKVTKEYGGKIYCTSSNENNPYQPNISHGLVDYKSNQVLDELGITTKAIMDELPKKRPEKSSQISYERMGDEDEDDLPF